MKKTLIGFTLFLTACGGGVEIPEVPNVDDMDLPSADDINAQIEADLAAAGIDVDMDALNEEADAEEVLDTPLSGDAVSSTTLTSDRESGTVGELYNEISALVAMEYPGATLVAYNSFDPNGYQDLFSPEKKFVDGNSELWYYFFALDGALDDEMIYASEIIVVKFEKGKMSFTGGDFSVRNEIGGDQVLGADLVKRDVTTFVGPALEAIEGEAASDKEIVHLDFECEPMWTAFADGRGYCYVYAFEEDDAGIYEIGIYLDNGEVDNIEYSEISEFSI
jgi:hypothetical protein